jgi:hypothetical protein
MEIIGQKKGGFPFVRKPPFMIAGKRALFRKSASFRAFASLATNEAPLGC